MLTSDPKLPQFSVEELQQQFVLARYWLRFQERFYQLWRSLADELLDRATGPTSSTDEAVARFDGATGKILQDSKLFVKDDGRVYGTALHNNAGAVTGTTNQYVASGTYTPSLTNVTNLDSTTANACQWMRVGNVVTVSGSVAINATDGAAEVNFRMSLPIASAFTAAEQCGGVARGTGVTAVALRIAANAANDEAEFRGDPAASTSVTAHFTFTYLVL